MQGIVKNSIVFGAWIGHYFFEDIQICVKNRAEVTDVITKLAAQFFDEFREEFDYDNWIGAFNKYNVESYSQLIHRWARQKLWEQYKISAE